MTALPTSGAAVVMPPGGAALQYVQRPVDSPAAGEALMLCAKAGVTRDAPPARTAAAPPLATKPLRKKARRSVLRSSRSAARCASNSGQVASSPWHIA